MTTPCRCIDPGPLTGHDGHCCLREWDPDTDPLPPCHPDQWQQLRDDTQENR